VEEGVVILRWLLLARIYLTAAVPVVLLAMLVWALVFGVTVGGRHHLVSCSDDRGLVIEARP